MNVNVKRQEISFPSNVGLHQLFAKQVKRKPNNTALIFDGEEITYAELDKKTNQLAQFLQALGIQREDLVAICLDRSIDMMIGIFGILKAGGAYLPIDVDYPEERRNFMLEDAKVKVLLTQSSLLQCFENTEAHAICMDTDWEDVAFTFDEKVNPDVSVKPENLAYTIYTSGSTGKPKGVMISHENIINQLEGQQDIAPTPIEKCLLTCSISFDVSVLTIFWTLLQGATLVLPKQGEEKDIEKLSEIIDFYKVTHLLTLPSLHTLILEQAPPERIQSLQLVNVSGEVCPTSLAQKHEQIIPNCQLYNLYGPTEAAVNCTFFKLPKGFSAPKVPIGIPILNYEMFILNESMDELGVGEVGEIYIGSTKPVVGRGYLNRPQLTQERFINNPHKKRRGGETLYKTGDLGRWMPDGNIEFLGRTDFQVKFRGYRIELGEIEVAIGRHDSVRETVVVLKNQHQVNQQKLVAYIVNNPNTEVNVSEMRVFLESRLPQYMIPTNFVFLDTMPLTTNGKIDRKALPDPLGQRPQLAQKYEAPITETERLLTVMWEEILEIQPIGRNDKFFELGGSSILAAKFLGKLQELLKTSIFVTTIFDHPTVSEYAAMLEDAYEEALKGLRNEQVEEKAEKEESFSERITSKDLLDFQKLIPTTLKSINTNQKEAKNKPAVFILAPPRSGTTLLRVMLAGHPQLFAANELQLLNFENLKDRENAYSGKFSLWKEGLIRVVMELKNCDADEAKAQILKFEKKGYSTKQMFAKIQEWIGEQILVDKSPSYALDYMALQKAENDFENPIYIHLVRHPYSMATSFEKYHMDQALFLRSHDFSARQLGEMVWLESHKIVQQFSKEIPAERYLRIQYEDLVRHPKATLEAICQTIGIPFDSKLLNPYEDLNTKMIDGIYKDSRSMGDVNFNVHERINPIMAEKWKGVLKDNFLNEHTWKLAMDLGYENPFEEILTSENSNIDDVKETVHQEDTVLEIKEESKDIAIIGMSCRVAGAKNIFEFWNNLIEAKDVSEELPTNGDANYVNRKYSLSDADCFDAAFFGYLPKEASMMDPQHRIFLETAYEALENAGCNPQKIDGKIGMFGGVAKNTYYTENILPNLEEQKGAGNYQDLLTSDKSFSISRVAYKLNLKGPAVNVQTACSTSGVAIHLACQSLLGGDSDVVLVGGGRIQPNLEKGYQYFEGGPLSPDGYLKAFDANAQGMVQGNGMGILVLKKLNKAIEDKDKIWAVIKSTSINNDGSDKIGFTAPSIKGQSDCIENAIQKAGIKASDLSFIEAHGTGTILGDPIEIQGLTKAFRKDTESKQFCAIGSVKTNIGHLDAGACVMGIIKTALSLHYEKLPASLNYSIPNPQIDFENSPFFVNDKLSDWNRTDQPRRAGISSFGLGGTNAHVILEEAPLIEERKTVDKPTEVLISSAKSASALTAYSQSWSTYSSDDSLGNIANNLALGRIQYEHRQAVIASNIEEAKNRLAKSKGEGVYKGNSEKSKDKVVFMFPGGGAQYVDMAKDLYENSAYFKGEMNRCFSFLRNELDLDVEAQLWSTLNDDKSLNKPAIALPALFIVEYALVKTWIHLGVQPSEMIGHSMGEYTAACIAGVMTVENAMRLVALRGSLFEALPAEGGMLSVPLSEKEVKSYMSNGLAVAVINKPNACVVSGSVKSVEKLENRLTEVGIESQRIHIAVAAHSSQVEPILEPFGTYIQSIELHKPKIPFVSNVTGTWITDEQATSPEYWTSHIRNTVRFSEGLETLFQEENKVFIEVGPGQTLSTFARQHSSKNKGQLILASIRHPKELKNDYTFFQQSIAKLWVNGLDINWENYFEGDFQKVPIPTYAFEKKRYWIEPKIKMKTISENNLNESNATRNQEPLNPENGLNGLSNEKQSNSNKPLEETLQSVGRLELLVSEVKDILHELSGLEQEEMEEEASFLELGFDSLFLSQVVIQVNNKFETKISFRQLFEEAPSILALGEMLDGILPEEKFQPVTVPMTVSNGNGSDNGFHSNGNGSNGDYHSNGNGNGNGKLPSLNLDGLNQNETLKEIVETQLEIMQQQLRLLQGQNLNIAKPNGNGSNGNGIKSKSNGSLKPSSNGEGKELNIKRNSKGVTAKLNNYKKISSNQEFTEQQSKNLKAFIEAYIAKTSTSKEMASEHKLYYADPRAVTGFSKQWKEMVYQIAARKSKGSKIWDVDGNEYLDFVMSYGVALFGHMPDFVQEAVSKQLEGGNSLDVLPPEATNVAKIICELSGMDRVTLANTGTEAVLGAVRAARTFSGKDKIAVFDTDYHGMIDQFMVRGVHFKDRTKALPTSPGISRHIAENTLVLDYDDPYVLQKLESEIKDLAAVVIEPVQAQNPHWQHFELIKEIRRITEKHDVALIFDEIINGFRLHQKGAQAWYDVEADIVAYGKSISGGVPLSAVAGKAKYMEAFDGGEWQYGDDSVPQGSVTYFASTFIKNALSVAAANAAMTELKRGGVELQNQLNLKAFEFAHRVKDVFLKLKAPLFIQCTSSFFMIKPADANPLTRLFHYFLRYQGVNMRERPCFISTAHSQEDMDKALVAIEKAVQHMFELDLIQAYEGEDLNTIVAPPAHLQTNDDFDVEEEEVDQWINLTEGQKEIFVSSQFGQEANCAYNIGTEIQLEGAIDIQKLEKSIQLVVQKHDALRLRFAKDGSKQLLSSEFSFEIPVLDWISKNPEEQLDELSELHLKEARTAFDLENGPLFRFKIIQLEEEKTLVTLVVHHIIVDGWSLGILTRDLGAAYEKLEGIDSIERVSLRSLNFKADKSFLQFQNEQEAYKASADFETVSNYWLNQFSGEIPQNQFPIDGPRPTEQTYNADCQRISFDIESYDRIKKIAAKCGSTFYFFLFGAFQCFVSRLGQQSESVIGIVAAGQNLPGNQSLVGHLANLLPIKGKITANQTFKDYLKNVRSTLLDAFDHQNLTFGELVKQLPIDRDASKNPLVTMVFNMDSPLDNLNYGSLQASTRAIQKQFETFDLFVNIKPLSDELLVEWFYNTDLFEEETIKNRLQEFQTFLNGILENPEGQIGAFPLVKQLELDGCQIEERPFDQPLLISQLFESQVNKTQDDVALIFEKEAFTYKELNEKANQLANRLVSEGVKSGEFVAIYLERSPNLIVGLLAILKTGAAYLPLDLANPKDRIDFILDDVNANYIISTSDLKENLPERDSKCLFLDEIESEIFIYSKENPRVKVVEENAAYIIYTSGSTGKPKGIIIDNKTISQHLLSMKDYLNFSPKEVCFSVISASFDPSVQDFFLPLICGAKVIVANQESLKDANLLKDALNESESTWMTATPATWRMLKLVGWKGKKDLNIISTGEALSKKLASELLSSGKTLWNFYGPTETTIYATAKQVTEEDLEENHVSHWVSIGKALPYTSIYILDSNLQPLPPNTPGEIFIGGFRVANGYHQREELTKKVFLSNPYNNGNLFYRTGDLGYMDKDGNILYINRKDNQIKLRGYRIELGEIEAKIRKQEGVEEVVVILREDEPGDKRLVAYLKSSLTSDIDIAQLVKALEALIPNYMIPSDFVQMESFPLTSSGKINRRALPKPSASEKIDDKDFSKPISETQIQLAKIWKVLLKKEQIGQRDNFYELGGHSLLAVGMMAKIEEQFGVRLPLVSLIDAATLEGIAQKIEDKLDLSKDSKTTEIVANEKKSLHPEKQLNLTEAQREIWVSHHLETEAALAFNLGSEVYLGGNLDIDRLEKSIQDLVERHEALRAQFDKDGQFQKVLPWVPVKLNKRDFSHLDDEPLTASIEHLRKTEIETVFDLQEAPLAKFTLVKIDEGNHLLIITMHHIVLDGWSLGVLINDLGQLYQLRAGKKVDLKETPAQLSDYVAHLNEWSNSKEAKESEEYWVNQFEKDIPVLVLPTDQPSQKKQSLLASEASILFSCDLIDQLQGFAKKHNTSFYSFMLAAFEAFLGKLSGQEEFVLGVSVSGKSIVNFNDLVAHRVNLLPLRAEARSSDSFLDHLKKANYKLLTAFDYQDYTLGTLIKKLKVTRDASHHPLVNMVFNMETMSRSYDFGDLKVETEFIPGNYKILDSIVHMRPAPKRSKGAYQFKWIYNKDLFTKGEIQRRLSEFEFFLQELIERPNDSIGILGIIPNVERQIIEKFEKSERTALFPPKCLHEFLEEQALLRPDATAIAMEDKSLTYKEFNEKSNQLANYLLSKGLKKGDFVGLCLEPSIDILISIYAILKAGGTYVPLDPLNPPKRLEMTLEDAKCDFLLTDEKGKRYLSNFIGSILLIDGEKEAISKEKTQNLKLEIASDQLAYIIYTSGSTGKPKGVGINHNSVINTLYGIDAHLKIGPDDSFYSVSSMAFDMSIPDYFLTVIRGARLQMASLKTKKDGFLLKEELDKYQPTMMQATPTTWKILLLSGWEGNSKLRVLAGGEGFEKSLAAELKSKCYKVWNGYGPTETTIYATFKEVTEESLKEINDQSFIPIGRPNTNVKLRILDKENRIVPIGVPGELYIGGPGVAKGYLERPKLTGEKFIKDKEAWYRTGDLVKWLPNGDVDFLGRMDHQLKIRGFRIELGEIEAELINQNGIDQAVVLYSKDRQGRGVLIAYLIKEASYELNENHMKDQLKKILPGYMVPNYFIQMESFPMTNSLKIDRKAFPIPDFDELRPEATITEPQTLTEQRLEEIWKEILGLNQLSTDEDFFELGGHSLLAVGLMSRIQTEFGKKIPVTTLFQNATIQKLGAIIDESSTCKMNKWVSLIPIKPEGSKPPIYLVHGGGLHVLFYQTLAKHLDEDQPVYALQAYGLDGEREPFDNIEEMAAFYIKEIIDQNPDGPYCLAGYSLGGLIAYDMARQFEKMDKKVNLLAMFDAVAKYNWEGEGASAKWKKRMKKAGYNLSLMMKDPAKATKYKTEVLKMQLLHLNGKINVAHGETKIDPTKNSGHLAGKKVYEKSMQAFEKYHLLPLDVKVDLFKAKDQMFYLNDPEFYGWNRFAIKGVDVHEIEGNHMNMFNEPNGVELAKKLQEVLDKENGE